jgi:hypothetical protein
VPYLLRMIRDMLPSSKLIILWFKANKITDAGRALSHPHHNLWFKGNEIFTGQPHVKQCSLTVKQCSLTVVGLWEEEFWFIVAQWHALFLRILRIWETEEDLVGIRYKVGWVVRKMHGRLYGGLMFVLVGSSLLMWKIVQIPAPTTVKTIHQRPKITHVLKAAYNTLVKHVHTVNGPGWTVALVGHDPCSIGISEGLRADAPWALDLWNSTRVATGGDMLKLNQMHQGVAPEQMSNWDWATRIINDSSRPDVQSIDNLWLNNQPFYVTDKEKASAPVEVQEALALWDNLQVRAYINEYYVASWTSNNTDECPPVTEYQQIRHTIGIVSHQDIATLQSWGYGFFYDKDWPEMQVYGLNHLCNHGFTKYLEPIIHHVENKVATLALCTGMCGVLDLFFFGPEDPVGDGLAIACEADCPIGVGLGLKAYETCTTMLGNVACPSLSDWVATEVCNLICPPAAWWLLC